MVKEALPAFGKGYYAPVRHHSYSRYAVHAVALLTIAEDVPERPVPCPEGTVREQDDKQ